MKNKRVLITGAGGFIGSHLTEKLVRESAHVTAFVRYNCRGDIGNLKWLSDDIIKNVDIYHGNVCELETIKDAVKDIDVIFNLAALVGIPYSYKHPQEVIDVNLNGALNVLIAARDSNIEKVVQTSTSEVYGTAQCIPIDEKHPKQPQSPYAASKIGADALALSFHMTYGLPVAIARPFNTYGPRQSDRAVIPTIISQALTQDSISLGNTKTTRDFNFVLDTVDGFIAIAESDQSTGQEINIGSGKEISIEDLVYKIVEIVGKDVKIEKKEERMRPDKSEVFRLLADSTKAKELVGWEPKVGLNKGLESTIDWIRSRLSCYSPKKYRT